MVDGCTGSFGCIDSTEGCDQSFECGGSRRGTINPKDTTFYIGDPWSPYKSTMMYNQGIFWQEI
jgi:hypothetical protein